MEIFCLQENTEIKISKHIFHWN